MSGGAQRSATAAVARWGLALSLLFVVYQTFLPFSFDLSATNLAASLERASWIPWVAPGGGPPGMGDVVGNLLLFVPAGLFFCLLPSRRGRRREWVAALAAGGALSAAIEALQLLTPTRYTQVSDVLVNAAGAGLGCLLARRGGARLLDAAVAWARDHLRRDPLPVALAALTGVVLLGALLPLDLSLARWSLVHHLRRAVWDPLALPPHASRLAAALSLVKQAWLLAFWGATAAACWAGRRAALARVATWGAALVVAAELSQFLVKSRVVTASEPLVGWLGAVAGAALVLSAGRLGPPRRVLAWVLGIGYAVYLVADCLSPVAATVLSSLREGRLAALAAAPRWQPVPFQGFEDLPAAVALGNWLGRLLRFVPLGGWVRLGVAGRRRALALAAAAGLIVLGLEVAVGWLGPWPGDATEVLLAWAGMAAGWALAGRLRRDRPRRTGAPKEPR